ncbi:hypothetical protein DM01DRAFT_1381068 [Hesseltinella vesiculosa]|uniref:Uncharacterized protein n=1 Tax=Hesseltinella vesiculosa TaxID=101127 RepID=A0A1X2GQV0_9FUNG|nr:hypothetical protein DM01DRAFT_1381068 [Hesseltinella vesiculosa]
MANNDKSADTTNHDKQPLTMTPESASPSTTPSTPNLDQPNDNIKAQLEANEDYQSVVRVLNVLKQQLTQATKDIETLTRLKRKALDDPMTFIEDLKTKKLKNEIPRLQKIFAVPEIDWTKYKYMPESRFAKQTASLAALIHQYTNTYEKPTMYKNILETEMPPQTIQDPKQTSPQVKALQDELAKGLEAIGQIAPSRATSIPPSADPSDTEDDPLTPTGMIGKRRLSTQTGMMEQDLTTESRTHNLPWTDEEQRRLEELLEIYPDEPVQAQRFNKISQAMGTRTPRQVASRIQKYFTKLAKKGLPVPGRINLPSGSTSRGSSRGRGRGGRARARRGRGGTRPTSMGYASFSSDGMTSTRVSGGFYNTASLPSVLMDDNDEQADAEIKQTMKKVATSVPGQTQAEPSVGNSVHEGFACDSCGMEPIVGTLYKCKECDMSEEVDLCSKCMELGTFTNDHHTTDHTFEAIRTAQAPYYDGDYGSPEHLGEYSYLGIF